uniref:Secreted protein n=1 Tax=Arundo donax TaxID=35708 RepID=A0A0A9D007_ARUDO
MGIPSMFILTRGLFLQVSFALSPASSFCRSGDCLDELPFVRFLLKDRTGGQPTTGRTAPLHRIRALVSQCKFPIFFSSHLIQEARIKKSN